MLRDRESAFTLVELLVGMVLLMVVVGGIIYAVTQMSNGSSSLAANRASQRDALESMEQMRHDLAAARSPALEVFDARRETLRDLMYFNDDSLPANPTDRSRNLCGGARGDAYIDCLRGITYADGDEIWFRAGVNNVSGSVAECIGYSLRRAGGQHVLRRHMSSSWRNCGPRTGGQSTVLFSSRTLDGGPIFTYTLRYNTRLVQGEAADLDFCRSANAPRNRRLNDAALSRISSVNIDLSGIATNRAEAAAAGLNSAAAVSAHLAGDYAYAMGCAP